MSTEPIRASSQPSTVESLRWTFNLREILLDCQKSLLTLDDQLRRHTLPAPDYRLAAVVILVELLARSAAEQTLHELPPGVSLLTAGDYIDWNLDRAQVLLQEEKQRDRELTPGPCAVQLNAI